MQNSPLEEAAKEAQLDLAPVNPKVPKDGETFEDWMARQGRPVELTPGVNLEEQHGIRPRIRLGDLGNMQRITQEHGELEAREVVKALNKPSLQSLARTPRFTAADIPDSEESVPF